MLQNDLIKKFDLCVCLLKYIKFQNIKPKHLFSCILKLPGWVLLTNLAIVKHYGC
jgi:hypothetical protein